MKPDRSKWKLEEDPIGNEDQGQAAGGGIGVRRRRRFTPVEKRRLLDEAEKPGEGISSVARRYGVAPSMMFG